MKKTNRKSGFTLVELMVVAAIIAILAAIIIPLLTKNKEAAVAADGQNIAGAVLNAAKSQYARTGTWPDYGDLDDDVLTAEVDAGNWVVDSITGPTDASITVSTTANQGYSGTITLSGGQWTLGLSQD